MQNRTVPAVDDFDVVALSQAAVGRIVEGVGRQHPVEFENPPGVIGSFRRARMWAIVV